MSSRSSFSDLIILSLILDELFLSDLSLIFFYLSSLKITSDFNKSIIPL